MNTPTKTVGTLLATALRISACVALLATARAQAPSAPTPGPATVVPTAARPSGETPGDPAPGEAQGGKGPKRFNEKSGHEQRIELFGLCLGAVAVVSSLGIAVLAIWTDAQKRRDLIASVHRERMAALEKGLDLPAFPSEWPSRDPAGCRPGAPGSGLKPGLMWLATGVGLWLFLSPKNHGLLHPSVGAIPAAVGVAHLVYFAVEGRKLKRRTDEA